MRSFENIIADSKRLYNMEYEILVEVTKKLKLIRESYNDLNQELCENYPQLNLEMSECYR
jgi:hypothetical protein